MKAAEAARGYVPTQPSELPPSGRSRRIPLPRFAGQTTDQQFMDNRPCGSRVVLHTRSQQRRDVVDEEGIIQLRCQVRLKLRPCRGSIAKAHVLGEATDNCIRVHIPLGEGEPDVEEVEEVAACSGHGIAMGSFVLMSTDVRIGVDGPFRIGMNEVAIGMTLPYFAVEIARQRLTPAYFNRAAILMPAHAATKLRVRGTALEALRQAISSELG